MSALIINNQTKPRILYLDIARVIAMLWIVGWWHLREYSGLASINFRFPGDYSITMLMLGLFMFLSGYLIGKKELKTKEEIVYYFKTRFWRFYFLLALSVFTFPITGYNNDISIMATTLTATSSFILPQPKTLWFLSMLTFFYIITPIIKKHYLFGIVFLFLFFTLNTLLPNGIDKRIFLYYPLYTMGLYLSPSTIIDRITNSTIVLIISFIVSLLLYICAMKYMYISFIFVIVGILFLFALSRFMEIVTNHKLIYFFAYSSLCTYLFHRQIYILFFIAISTFVGRSPNILECFLFLFPLCVVLSYLLQRTYDGILKKCLESN